MKEDEFTLHIGGEATKAHTIPVDMLGEIGKSLQDLLQKIALFDLPTTETIDPANFKLELSKFGKGSAIPTFVFTQNVNQSPLAGITEQRKALHEKFNALMEVASDGNYLLLRDMYKEPIRRNEIVSSVYSFVDSFRNAPVEILDARNKPKYRIKKFKKTVRDAMLTQIKENISADKEKSVQVAKVRIVREKGKSKILRHDIVEIFGSKVRADYCTDTIVHGETVYELKFNLSCAIEDTDGVTKIENDMLGIMGHGLTIEEAEKSFSEEFDYVYKRYNQLPDKKLSDDVKKIKTLINILVKNVSH
ncbi:MAG TPA: hypothetical protein VK154_09660 [Chitinophagales bacterium]|nr:hypothetical protein [Chitinophagales bacterium]